MLKRDLRIKCSKQIHISLPQHPNLLNHYLLGFTFWLYIFQHGLWLNKEAFFDTVLVYNAITTQCWWKYKVNHMWTGIDYWWRFWGFWMCLRCGSEKYRRHGKWFLWFNLNIWRTSPFIYMHTEIVCFSKKTKYHCKNLNNI